MQSARTKDLLFILPISSIFASITECTNTLAILSKCGPYSSFSTWFLVFYISSYIVSIFQKYNNLSCEINNFLLGGVPSPKMKGRIPINSSPDLYNKRYDLIEIKRELESLVPSDEYWKVLRLFINGKCQREEFDNVMEKYLDTSEKKHLHNKFIRSIIFNAHFSTIYPPGYVPKRKILSQGPSPEQMFTVLPKRSSKFKTYSAADLRAIPSILDFQKKLEIKSQQQDMAISRDCGEVLHNELKKFILYVLDQSLLTVGKPPTTYRTLKITSQNVKEAISMNEKIASIISEQLYKRYAEFN